jgi:hypothetical protein
MMQKKATNSALRTHAASPGDQRIEHDAENKEGVVGQLAAELVRQRGPEEAAADVEQREQADEAAAIVGDLRLLIGIESG